MKGIPTALVLVLLAGCPPRGGFITAAPAGGGGGGGVVSQPEPPADTRNPGQVIVDIITSQGYACTAEENRWACMAPGGNWQMYVSYIPTDNPVTIWLDSYTNRAFARPCAEFTNAMNDLVHTGDWFMATCDDSAQQFRFNTRFSYRPDSEVMTWVKNHESHRSTSWTLLDSIKAVRK